MKSNKMFLSVLLLMTSIVSKTFSQNQTFPDGLSIVIKADRIDTLNSSSKLGTKYNHVSSYNGKFLTYVNYRCGVTDAAGNVIIPEFNQSIIRNGDVFEVRKGDQHKLIDTKGRIICEYDHLIKMSDQLYRARKNNKLGVVDINGKEIVPCEYMYIGNISDNKTIKIRKGNKFGIVTEQGNIIIPCNYDFIQEDNASFKVKQGIKWGVIATEGKIIIPCEYDFIVNDKDLYRVKKSNKWGVIDSYGKIIIPMEYDFLAAYENGVFKVMKDDYLGFIDKNNRVVIDIKYVYINPFVNGVAEACECEDFVQASNQLMVKLYEKRGYTLLKTPTRVLAMGKNPVYSQLKIESLK